jgi:hypothetical protein
MEKPPMTSRRPPRRRGALGVGLAEYVIVLALIAIATVGVITLFGDRVRMLLGLNAPPPQIEVEAQRPSGRATRAGNLPDAG